MNRYYRISLYCILSYTKLNSIADDLLHTPVVCMQGFSHRHVGLQFNANAHQLDRCKVLDSGDVQPENLILKVDQIRCLFLLVVTCKCLYWDLQLYKIFVLIKNILLGVHTLRPTIKGRNYLSSISIENISRSKRFLNILCLRTFTTS